MAEAGYDKETGLFGVFDPKDFNIPENPTKEDAEEALALISELLYEFSFATEADKVAALSAILTAVIRASLRLAPHVPCASSSNQLRENIFVFDYWGFCDATTRCTYNISPR